MAYPLLPPFIFQHLGSGGRWAGGRVEREGQGHKGSIMVDAV